MDDIEIIMGLLDWHNPPEVQAKGRVLAKNIKEISFFLQPTTPKYNKNVWDNCARIISEREDVDLRPYLAELLEWLQDLNWPGALCILDRLKKFKDKNSLRRVLVSRIEDAKQSDDEIWLKALHMVLDE